MKSRLLHEINAIIKTNFNDNPKVITVLAKDQMPHFIEAHIFDKDQKRELLIRKILGGLAEANSLHLIPSV